MNGETEKRNLTNTFNDYTKYELDDTKKTKYNEELSKYKLSQEYIFNMTADKYRYGDVLNKINDLIVIIKNYSRDIQMETINLEKQGLIIDKVGSADLSTDYKNILKSELEKTLKPYDISTYAESKENNMALIYRFDKILTESINAIKVYVKARKEDGYINIDKEKLTYNTNDETCLIVGNKPYGKFEKIFWTTAYYSDLYCGKNVPCKMKIPLSKGVRDTIESRFKSNIYYTEGFSGSGKTTMLTGVKNATDENKTGIIARIIQDLFSNYPITSNGTQIKIEYLIGEVYGEKQTLSLLDHDFSECLYLWKLGDKDNLPEEVQFISLQNNSDVVNLNIKNLDDLEKSRSIYSELDPNYKFKVSDFDKAKYLTVAGLNSATQFDQETVDNIKKFVCLKNYNGGDADTKAYKEKFKVGLEGTDQLYEIFSGKNDYYKEFIRTVYNRNQIVDKANEMTNELTNKINIIQQLRREKNRVRCTKYNPDSSRSHMFFIFRLIDTFGQDKYYIFVDKAGNEIPYSIAVGDFGKLSAKVDQNSNFPSVLSIIPKKFV
jgi:hypothetical protein